MPAVQVDGCTSAKTKASFVPTPDSNIYSESSVGRSDPGQDQNKSARDVMSVFSGVINHSFSRSNRFVDGSVRLIAAGKGSYLEVETMASSEVHKFPLALWTEPSTPTTFRSLDCKPTQFKWLFKGKGRTSVLPFIEIKFKPVDVNLGLADRLDRVVQLYKANFKPDSGLNATMLAANGIRSQPKGKQPVPRLMGGGVRVDCDDQNKNSANRQSSKLLPSTSTNLSSSHPHPIKSDHCAYQDALESVEQQSNDWSPSADNTTKADTDDTASIQVESLTPNKENAENKPIVGSGGGSPSLNREVNASTFGFGSFGRDGGHGDGIPSHSFYGTPQSSTSYIGRKSPSLGRALQLNNGVAARRDQTMAAKVNPQPSMFSSVLRMNALSEAGGGDKSSRSSTSRTPSVWLSSAKKQPPQPSRNQFRDPSKPQVISNRLAGRPPPNVSESPIVLEHRKGFTNIGNSCYMNVVLQTLLNLHIFSERLVSSCIALDNFLPDTCLTRSLWQLFLAKDETLSSKKSDLLRQVKQSMRSLAFDNYAQQDSHEFLTAVLDQTRVELRAAGRLYTQAQTHTDHDHPDQNGHIRKGHDHHMGDCGDIGQGLGDIHGDKDTDEGHKCVLPLTDQEVDNLVNQKASCAPQHDVIAHTFGFNMQQLIKCGSDSCGLVIRRTQFFAELAVADSDEARKERGLHLEQLLNICHGEEPIDEFKCEECAHVGVINSTQIVHLPEILVIQVKRYVYDAVTNTQRKSQKAVVFPHLLALDAHYDPSPLADTPIKPEVKKEPETKLELAETDQNDQTQDKHTDIKKDSSVESDTSFVTVVDAAVPDTDSTAGGFLIPDDNDLDVTIDREPIQFHSENNMPHIKFADEQTPMVGDCGVVSRLSSEHKSSDTVALHSPIRRRRPATQFTAMNTKDSDDDKDTDISLDEVPSTPENKRRRLSKRTLSAIENEEENTSIIGAQAFATINIGVAASAPKAVLLETECDSPVAGALDVEDEEEEGDMVPGVDGDGTGADLDPLIRDSYRYIARDRPIPTACVTANTHHNHDHDDNHYDNNNHNANNHEDNLSEFDKIRINRAVQESIWEAESKKKLEQEEKEREERELQRALEESQLQSAIEQSKLDMPPAELDVEAEPNTDIDESGAAPSFKQFVPATGEEQFVYKLTAVLSHLGHTNNTGHYICDVYKPSSDSWQSCDDSAVSDISLDRVLRSRQCSVYILLYQRIHNISDSEVKVKAEAATKNE